jgi:hypothetical protein
MVHDRNVMVGSREVFIYEPKHTIGSDIIKFYTSDLTSS